MKLYICLYFGMVATFRIASACIAGGSSGGTTNPQEAFGTILGGNAKAGGYSSGGTGGFIEQAPDLNCANAAACRWSNSAGDQFDWSKISGKPDPARLELTSGAKQPWSPDALGVISDKRPATDKSLLVSDPIGCAPNGGTLRYTYWKSKGLPTEAQAPKLETCWRPKGGTELNDCNVAPGPIGPNPGTVSYTFPIAENPIELVIVASNFVTDAEIPAFIPGVPSNFKRIRGGYVIIDDMTTEGEVQATDGCFSDTTQNPTDFTDPTDSTDFTDGPTDPTGPPGGGDLESCNILSCDFFGDTCSYAPGGGGGSDEVEWEGPLTAQDNSQGGRSNPLTGIRKGPFNNQNKDRDDKFVKCKFGDPAKDRISDRYQCIMASSDIPGFDAGSDPHMCMQVYLATQGVQIVAEDDNQSPLWESAPLKRGRDAVQNRQWREECFSIRDAKQVRIVSKYDGTRKYNAGEVGVAGLSVKKGRGGSKIC